MGIRYKGNNYAVSMARAFSRYRPMKWFGIAAVVVTPASVLGLTSHNSSGHRVEVEANSSSTGASLKSQTLQPKSSNVFEAGSPEVNNEEVSVTSESKSGHNSNSASSSVTVDGQSFRVDGNGALHKEVETRDGAARVDMSVDSNSTGNSSSSSTLRFHTRSSSRTTISE